jgi:threonine synthase
MTHAGTLSRINVRTSLAPAMDIGVPYNIERILHLITGGDTALVASLTCDYYDTGTMVVPADVHSKVLTVVHLCAYSLYVYSCAHYSSIR